MSVWQDAGTGKTNGDLILVFCMFWNHVKMKHWNLPTANQYLTEVPEFSGSGKKKLKIKMYI